MSEFNRPFFRYALLSFALYALFPLFFPLIPQINELPLQDVRSFAPNLVAGLTYGFVFTLLFYSYRQAFLDIDLTLNFRWILAFTILFALPLLITYPINANDIYRYYLRGRLAVIYDANPFITTLSHFPNDPFIPFAGEWANFTSPYGPLWELLSRFIASLNPNNLIAGVLSYKLLAIGLHIISGIILAQTPPGTGHLRRQRALLWLWNPALLLMFAVDGHNDILMLFWFILGSWLWHKEYRLLALTSMLLAPLTKPIGLLPLPFFYLAALRDLPDRRQKFNFTAILTAVGLLLLVLFTAPFDSLTPLINRLINEATGGASFSPIAALILASRTFNFPLDYTLVTQIGIALFLLFALYLAWRTYRHGNPFNASGDIFYAYLLQALNFRIWYPPWLFPLYLLGSSPRLFTTRLNANFYFLYTSQISVILYGHVYAYLLQGDLALIHFITVPFVFLLPWLLGYLYPWKPQ